MNDLRYIEDEKKFLDHSFDVFKKYFNNNRESFNSFYKSINSNDRKNKFLKIASSYYFLVVGGKFIVESNSPDYIDYLDHTYKYIAIFAFIENLYTDKEYKEFYSWLESKKTNIKFPIKDKEELDVLHKQYLSTHGSTQKAIRFFESLDNKTKKCITDNFQIIGNSNDTESFIYLSKLLYQIRNNFVHNAEIISQFNTGVTIHTIGGKLIKNNLDFEKMKMIFENGFLRFFGFVSTAMTTV